MLIKWLSFIVLLSALVGAEAQVNAASCNTTDVQTAINTATEGQTVTIPAGNCIWTSGVTISGKGIAIVGSGTSQIVAYSSSTLAIGTGTLTLTALATPLLSVLPISTGQTLKVEELNNIQNYMTGTVTSYDTSTGALVMNITSTGGKCGNANQSNCARWMVATVPASQTILTNNVNSNNGMFNVTEDTSFHTSFSNFAVAAGTYTSHIINLNYASGGQAVLINNVHFSGNPNSPEEPDGSGDMIRSYSNRGVVWDSSFDGSPFNISTIAAIEIKDSSNLLGAWTSPSYWGASDTTGQNNFYVENCFFGAIGFATSTDDNGRMVVRHSLYDNSGVGTHGADTSPYGQRYFENYNNTFVFNGYSDGTTFNIAAAGLFYVRGGSYVIYNDTIPALTSQDYGTKPAVNMTVMNLQRNSGPDACWGAGTSSGACYHAPRQVGYGRVTGGGESPSASASGCVAQKQNDSVTYVGDSEPAYIWGNSTEPLSTALTDYGGSACTGPDSTVKYIVANRDYFNGTTAKPGYTPYTYPHPLTQGSPNNTPAAPTGLAAVVH